MINRSLLIFQLSVATVSQSCAAFQPSIPNATMRTPSLSSSSALAADAAVESGGDDSASLSFLYDPSARDDHYAGNVARYLVDLHNEKATFNFCGGMMFQLVLSDKLKSEFEDVVAAGSEHQPIIHDYKIPRMSSTPDYRPNAVADNVRIFHGREIRQVTDATGGMGFVLQLSHAATDDGADADPQGWTPEEIAGYNGWMHDQGRTWRKGDRYEREGFGDFRKRFGSDAFGLHHRCYLHYDNGNRMWLSAEDGCEGTPAEPSPNIVDKLQSILFGR